MSIGRTTLTWTKPGEPVRSSCVDFGNNNLTLLAVNTEAGLIAVHCRGHTWYQNSIDGQAYAPACCYVWKLIAATSDDGKHWSATVETVGRDSLGWSVQKRDWGEGTNR